MHWNSNEWCVWGGDVRFCIVPTSKPLATPDMQGKIWKWSLNMYSLVQAWKDWIALTSSFIAFTNTLPIRTEVAVLCHLMHRLSPQPLVCNNNNTLQPPSTIFEFHLTFFPSNWRLTHKYYPIKSFKFNSLLKYDYHDITLRTYTFFS